MLVFNNVEYTVRLIKGTPPIPQTLLPTAEFIADVAYATKEDVVFIFAKAWNRLEPEEFWLCSRPKHGMHLRRT
ncbi:hypothetical protein [Comamonas aquatica]|uniref:hypothetical protein n=1 Tax=Comamonas aquatica TaxID=225991 RepID=UPI003D06E06E